MADSCRAFRRHHDGGALFHTRAAAHQSGVKDNFERKISIKGNLSEEQTRKLIEIAGRCLVSRTLEHGADIETSLD